MGPLLREYVNFSNSKGCTHPMLNIFCPIVVGEFVLILPPFLIKVHPHWKMGMVSPLNPKEILFYK